MPVSSILALALAVALVGGAAAEPLPAGLTPHRISGAGFTVTDLAAQRDWYVTHLGLHQVGAIGPKDKPFELVLSYDDAPSHVILVLLKGSRPAGPNTFSRLILEAPDAVGLADRLKGEGAPVKEVIPKVAYFVTDPEGNTIELYQSASK